MKTAQSELVGWIKNHREVIGNKISDNPKTKLNYAKSLPEAKEYLIHKLNVIINEENPNNPNYYYIISTYYEIIEEYTKAHDSLLKYLELNDINYDFTDCATLPDFFAFLDNASEHRDKIWKLIHLRCQLRYHPPITYPSNPSSIAPNKVDRVSFKDLSPSVFSTCYCKPGIPVVIADIPDVCSHEWTLKHIQDSVGSQTKIKLKSLNKYSGEWAQLDDDLTESSIGDFFKNMGNRYLFDWSLPLFAPSLNDQFKIPCYFRDDYLKSTDSPAYKNSWPSLFVAAGGTGCGLHIDAFQSHFWMYLISGCKKWTFFDPTLMYQLNPKFNDNSMDITFKITKSQYESLPRYEVDLKAGETLFVPFGWPHVVTNIETSVAVSGNFVNSSNIASVVESMKINSLIDDQAADILKQFHDLKLIPEEDEDDGF